MLQDGRERVPPSHDLRGNRRGRMIPLLAQLLEMQLTNPAAIGLSYSDEIILNLDLLALLGKMA